MSAIARADLLSELQSLALHDPLTGLPNRRAWDAALSAAVARAERDGRPLSAALLDVDAFEEFNDTHGHQAGDRLLKEATAAREREFREGDVLAGWGVDEFALLLLGEPLQKALVIAERLLEAVPQSPCSAGVAEWTPTESADGVLARAAAERFAAKARR
ncbi:MAG: GGDEF domain-containing protein, partial [Actinomycetota bacterium]|nr:GGDEF domain-containing protein [Actinomycetota bacterium]